MVISSRPAHAAVIRITPSATSTLIGQPVRFDVSLDTQGSDVNTIQASLVFPPNLFALQLVDDGDSIVSFWITAPAASSSDEVDLAGIIPGGFNGSSGPIVSLELQPIASGTGMVSVAAATVLANDGQGTTIPTSVSSTPVFIASTTVAIPVEPEHSLVGPEPFTPQIEQDPNLFNDQYFLVFSTNDKGTGIDHYEVMEVPTGWVFGSNPTWHVAQSPYLLEDQSLSSNIYVRAVDHAGNFIVAEVPARYPHSAPNILLVDIVIGALVVVLGWSIWLVRRKGKR